MTEPIRWREDPMMARELRAVLGRIPQARPLDASTRARISRRLVHSLAIPLVLTSWLTMKTAAASLAITAGAVTIGAVVVHEVHVVRELSAPLAPGQARPAPKAPTIAPVARAAASELVEPDSVATAAFPELDEPAPDVSGAVVSDRPRALAVPMAAKPSGSAPRDDLQTEAAMLELARRSLGSSPGEALAIVDEHRGQFPRAALGLERELIRVEALIRLGRKAEARSLAQGLRQRGGLYSERVDRLIERIDGQTGDIQ